MAARRGPAQLTDQHKAAMAQGRSQGRAVRRYLEALEAHKPKRGRKRTTESIKRRLNAVEREIQQADQLKRLQLVQERMDLQGELESQEQKVDLEAVEQEFVDAAKPYGERKGISYAAWRELGVPASVLKKAGIGRGAGG